jgi:protein-tyrosine-phosphatase
MRWSVLRGQIVTEKVGPESKMQEKPLVLILCTGNSCRSHWAEGILRQKAAELIRVESAGSKPTGFVHPLAIRAMEEIGIDISGHRSMHLEEFLDQKVHTVVTVYKPGNATVSMSFAGGVKIAGTPLKRAVIKSRRVSFGHITHKST